MEPARIVHLLGTAGHDGTAILRLVDALVEGAERRGHESECWFLGGEGVLLDRLLRRGQRARSLGWRGSGYAFQQVLRFRMLLRRVRPDLLCQHSGGRMIRRVARSCGARVVLHVHEYVWERHGLHPVAISSAGADAIIANSRATAAKARLGGQVHVIYPGVDVLDPRPLRPLGVDTNPVVLGAAGRLAPVKGLDVLIEATARLSGKFPRIRLEIAGSGPERSNLEVAARDTGIVDRVAFLDWCDDLTPVFSRWDLFIQPARAEGFGLAVLEAMAAGVPVIASAVGGLPELIEHDRTGWLVPAGDAGALAAMIDGVLSDPAGRHAVGEAGRRRAASEFTTRRMVDSTLAIYTDVLAGGAH